MKNSINVFFLLVILLITNKTFGQPMWCGITGVPDVFTNIHDNGFDVCFIVPLPGTTYNYKYEIRIGSESGSIVQTGYDTKDYDGNRLTQVTGLSPGTLYYLRAAYETSPGIWSAFTDSRSVTTTVGVYSLPSFNPSRDRNYMVSVSYMTEAREDVDLPVGKEERYVTIQYFDGLGRPLQEIAHKGSPSGNDLVQPHAYDGFGREAVRYLPYVSPETNGNYKANPVSAYTSSPHQQFYTNGVADKVIDDGRPFSETMFEASPLNRPLKDYGAGSAWAPAPIGNNKFVEHRYLINIHGSGASTTHEEVIAWKFNAITGLPERESAVTDYIESGGYYSSGQLFVNVTVDEQGNAVREYTNKQGQVILKKVQAVKVSTNLNSSTDWACTYYIYNDFGNLVVVLPPEAVKALTSN